MLRYCHPEDVVIDKAKVSICMRQYDRNPFEDAHGLIYRSHVDTKHNGADVIVPNLQRIPCPAT